MTANADVAYKTICKLAGINVVIDPDFRAQNLTIDLTDVTLREALDMVRLQSKSYWRPVLSNTIFVTSDSPAKRKELEPNVMKTFYLQNVTAPTDLQDAANVLRQVLDVNRVQLIPAQDALVIRGTEDQMLLAQKLLSQYRQAQGGSNHRYCGYAGEPQPDSQHRDHCAYLDGDRRPGARSCDHRLKRCRMDQRQLLVQRFWRLVHFPRHRRTTPSCCKTPRSGR